MKKIMITGVMGLIGTNLAKRLLSEGNEVIGVDNFYCSERKKLDVFNEDKNFRFIEHDITKPFDIDDGNIDVIFNLACPARHPLHIIIEEPTYVMKVNALGIMNITELAKKVNAKVIHTSTAEVYGIPTIVPTPESYWGYTNPVGERSSYDEGKRFCEAYSLAFREANDVDMKIVRIFNHYGPYMDEYDGRVISAFIVQALRNEPITVYGDGSHTRSFCYVSDGVEGLVRVMNTEKEFMGPINIGNPEEITILDLAKKIINLTNSKSKIDFSIGFPSDDPRRRQADISFAYKKLGWKPLIELDKGLKETINFYKNILKI